MRKTAFIHVGVTVVIFNAHSRKAILGESTAKNVRRQRIGIQVESGKKDVFVFGFVHGDNGFENMIKRSLFLVVFELFFYCHYDTEPYHTKPRFKELHFHAEYLAEVTNQDTRTL